MRLVFFRTLAKCGAAPGVPHLSMDLSALTDLPPGKPSPKGCSGEIGGASMPQKCRLSYLLDANERSGRVSTAGRV